MDRAEIQSYSSSLSPRVSHSRRGRKRVPGPEEGSLKHKTSTVRKTPSSPNKGLTPEAAAPVVHTVNNCQATGLTTLQLAASAQKDSSSHHAQGPWAAFACNNGTWTPQHDGSTSQDEAAILNKAAEL
ncbi:hypothetical protein AoKodu_03570 [Actinomyces oris K20]|nr:hypothetical protein AoKodu_03570 [Actinomyces oris K20]